MKHLRDILVESECIKLTKHFRRDVFYDPNREMFIFPSDPEGKDDKQHIFLVPSSEVACHGDSEKDVINRLSGQYDELVKSGEINHIARLSLL